MEEKTVIYIKFDSGAQGHDTPSPSPSPPASYPALLTKSWLLSGCLSCVDIPCHLACLRKNIKCNLLQQESSHKKAEGEE